MMDNQSGRAEALENGSEDIVDEAHRLRGNMGLAKLIFIVAAFNAPLTIVASTVHLAIGFGNGVQAPLLFIGLGVVMSVFAVGYNTMAKILPRAGAFYTFVTAGLGRHLGLVASFVAVVTYALALLGTLPFFGLAFDSLLRSHGAKGVPWWLAAVLLAGVVGCLGYLRVDFSARVLGVVVVLEILALVIYDIVVAVHGGADRQLSTESFDIRTFTFSGVGVGILFAFSCFSGFESTALYRDEVRDPARTIPRATYLAVGIIAVFYAVTSWLIIQAWGPAKAGEAIADNPAGAFLVSVRTYLGPFLVDIITAMLVTSAFASILALHNVVSRYLFNLGVDGVLPRFFGRPHPQFGSPYRTSTMLTAVLMVFVVITAAAGADPQRVYTVFAGMSGFGFVLLLLLAAVGISAYLVRRGRQHFSVWRWSVAPITSLLLVGVIAVLVTTNLDSMTGSSRLSTVTLVAFACVVAAGLVAGEVWRYRLKRAPRGLSEIQ
ncbi:APC family permease [Nocardia pseudovaccinii]|uniref:APC family permease n=1 Tax=Nocardia pseudovaccinii TaxID=189540 RepID=UPI003D8B9829